MTKFAGGVEAKLQITYDCISLKFEVHRVISA